MLAEFTLLLHEMSDSLWGRHHVCDADPQPLAVDAGEVSVVVTGLASTGKTRLVEALARRLRPTGIVVEAVSDVPLIAAPRFHVHAETDVDALIEGAAVSPKLLHKPEVVVPVDWEPVERSVTRVIEHLIARGVATATVGV